MDLEIDLSAGGCEKIVEIQKPVGEYTQKLQ